MQNEKDFVPSHLDQRLTAPVLGVRSSFCGEEKNFGISRLARRWDGREGGLTASRLIIVLVIFWESPVSTQFGVKRLWRVDYVPPSGVACEFAEDDAAGNVIEVDSYEIGLLPERLGHVYHPF